MMALQEIARVKRLYSILQWEESEMDTLVIVLPEPRHRVERRLEIHAEPEGRADHLIGRDHRTAERHVVRFQFDTGALIGDGPAENEHRMVLLNGCVLRDKATDLLDDLGPAGIQLFFSHYRSLLKALSGLDTGVGPSPCVSLPACRPRAASGNRTQNLRLTKTVLYH